MIKIFLIFLKNKNYFFWISICLFMLLIIFSPLLIQTENYILEEMTILDTTQLFKSMVLPISYINSNGVLLNICSDVIFYLMLLYPISSVLEYFLKDSSTILLPKLGRRKWVKNVLISEVVYCIIICFIYVVFVLLLLFCNYSMNINILTLFEVWLIKTIIGLLSIYAYTLIILVNEDTFYSMIFSILIFFIINITYYFILGMNSFISLVILIVTNIILIIILEFLCNTFMRKRDL